MRASLAPLALLLLLCGCWSYREYYKVKERGPRLSREKLSRLERGKTRTKDVREMLGEPFRKDSYDPDNKWWVYVYSPEQEVENISILGHGGADVRHGSRLTLYFDIHSVLKDYKLEKIVSSLDDYDKSGGIQSSGDFRIH